jgi:hypothetical protein
VSAADEVWRLQRGDDAECRTFQSFAKVGHYPGAAGTKQGIYLVTPGGRLLASANTLSPAEVLATLRSGLVSWNELSPQERGTDPPPVDSRHRWEKSRPGDGLVLRSILRDLGPDLAIDPETSGLFNLDHAWFSSEEVAGWLPKDATPGTTYPVSDLVIRRLARFHLVDNVLGQTLPFADEEIVAASLEGRVLSREGNRVTIALRGKTSASADGVWRLGDNDWKPTQPWPRTATTELLGSLVVDVEAGSIEELSLVALLLWTGHTRFNTRRTESGQVGILFERVPADQSVAPAFVDIYDASWIEKP